MKMKSDGRHETVYSSIFPSFVAVSVCKGEGYPSLGCEEEKLLRGVAPQRAREFAAGRRCARRALDSLGVTDTSVSIGSDHAPAWPRGIVGSISHTIDLCVAVACRSRDAAGIGVDVECTDLASWEIAPVLCTAAERFRIDSIPRNGGAALLLSAKESLFKAYHPVTGFCLSLGDVDVTFEPRRQRYLARLVNDYAPSLVGVREFYGRYRVDGQYVHTGLVLPVGGNQQGG